MRITFFHRVFAAVAVLTLASGAMSALSSERAVWCVGEDGHSEREASVNGVCASDAVAWRYQASAERATSIREADHGGHCGPCTDSEILSTTHVLNAQSRTVCIPIPPANLVTYSKFTWLHDEPPHRFIEGGFTRGALTFSRSVSLRI